MNNVEKGAGIQRRFAPEPLMGGAGAIRALAEAEGLELTNAHWVVLNAIREFYDANDIPPSCHAICKKVESIGAPFRYDGGYAMRHLFPAGGLRQALRIAGIPREFCSGC